MPRDKLTADQRIEIATLAENIKIAGAILHHYEYRRKHEHKLLREADDRIAAEKERRRKMIEEIERAPHTIEQTKKVIAHFRSRIKKIRQEPRVARYIKLKRQLMKQLKTDSDGLDAAFEKLEQDHEQLEADGPT